MRDPGHADKNSRTSAAVDALPSGLYSVAASSAWSPAFTRHQIGLVDELISVFCFLYIF